MSYKIPTSTTYKYTLNKLGLILAYELPFLFSPDGISPLFVVIYTRTMILPSLRYAYLKCIAILLRTLIRLATIRDAKPKPDEIIHLPSRDARRTIKAHIYRQSSSKKPSA